MMKIKRILFGVILCAALVLGLSACSGSKAYMYTLNFANLRMSVGQEQQLSVTVDPLKEFTASYESSDPAVASVSEDGLVKAVAYGKAVITVTTGDVSLVCNVTVVTEQYVWSLNYGAAIIGVGADITLQPSVLPQKEFSAVYSSSDESVASVSESGTVKGLKEGTAVITVDVGDAVLTCEISVSASVSNYVYALNVSSLDLYESAEAELVLTVLPEKETAVKFTSSDASVVTVDENGKVIAVAEGTAEIYAEADGQRFVCAVNVRPIYVLNYKSAALAQGDSLQLSVTNAIEQTAASDVQYKSDDAEIASIDGSGLITAVSEGTALITASVGSRELVCVVTVSSAEEGNE